MRPCQERDPPSQFPSLDGSGKGVQALHDWSYGLEKEARGGVVVGFQAGCPAVRYEYDPLYIPPREILIFS